MTNNELDTETEHGTTNHLWGFSTEVLQEKYNVDVKSLECPHCGKEILFPIFDYVNVTKNKELKEKILNKEVFTLYCPYCGSRKLLMYPMLYRDDALNYVLELCQSEQAAVNYRFPLDHPVCKALANTHTFRTVVGTNGLIEKIKILDSQMNEFAIAYLKKRIFEQKNELKFVFFEGVDEDCILFTIMSTNGTMDIAKIPVTGYKLAIGYVDACGYSSNITSYYVDTYIFNNSK